jgi:hypothetical protein
LEREKRSASVLDALLGVISNQTVMEREWEREREFGYLLTGEVINGEMNILM